MAVRALLVVALVAALAAPAFAAQNVVKAAITISDMDVPTFVNWESKFLIATANVTDVAVDQVTIRSKAETSSDDLIVTFTIPAMAGNSSNDLIAKLNDAAANSGSEMNFVYKWQGFVRNYDNPDAAKPWYTVTLSGAPTFLGEADNNTVTGWLAAVTAIVLAAAFAVGFHKDKEIVDDDSVGSASDVRAM